MNLKNHLEKLEYFLEVSKAGSFKAASEKLFITQPSLSKSIKHLEEEIQRELFVRGPRGVVLTREGVVLQNFCESLFSSIKNLEKKLESPDEKDVGTIRIGTYDSIGIYFWPDFLNYYFKKYPKVEIDLTTGRSQEMQKKLLNNEIDIALIIEPQEGPNVSTLNLATDTFKFYETTSKTKAYKNSKEAPLIIMTDAIASEKRSTIGRLINSKEVTSRKIYKTSSLESAKELVVKGLGIALLPSMVARAPLKSKLLKETKIFKEFSDGIGKHQIGVAYQNNSQSYSLITTILDELSKQNWK